MKQLRFLSVCSGMEAASIAWEPLGWKAVGFCEIDPFASAVLAHRFPNTPNYGDLTKYKQWPFSTGDVDIIIGGPPCQAFSFSGLRRGLADPRGNLTLTYLGLVDRLRPEWVVYENVPGLLSVDGGRTFGTFLHALGQLGYGWAYRVLDAQHVGECRLHPHRRGWSAVPQRRRRVFVVARRGAGGWASAAEVLSLREGLQRHLAAGGKKKQGVAPDAGGGAEQAYPINTLTLGGRPDPINDARMTIGIGNNGDPQFTLQAAHCHAVATSVAVRRLTPNECLRLQGFPDNWTNIPWKGKPTAPDGPQYKCAGNSFAVPVVRWIGTRIASQQ